MPPYGRASPRSGMQPPMVLLRSMEALVDLGDGTGWPMMLGHKKEIGISTVSLVNSNTPRLETLANLLQRYDRDTHLRQLLPENHERYEWFRGFKYLFSPKWKPPGGSPPYIAATALLDAYSHLPRRPDLAFMLTWSATNSAYNDLYMHDVTAVGAVLGDTKSIDLAADRIASQLHKMVTRPAGESVSERTVSIQALLLEYVEAAPDKVWHFVASYVLKGFALAHFSVARAGTLPVRPIHIPSAYHTFRRNYQDLHGMVAGRFGPKYVALCQPQETPDRTDVNFRIKAQDAGRSRRLVHALGVELKELWRTRKAGSPSTSSDFTKDADWVRFPLQCILYASRNTNVHGNAATRLSSIWSDAESVSASAWMFVACYAYLGLILLCTKELALDDLHPLVSNIETFKSAG